MPEQPAKGMRCVECGTIYPISLVNYGSSLSDKCHFSPLELFYNPPQDLRMRIEQGPRTLFRYLDLLPNSAAPDYEVGMTPLVREDGLAEALGFGKGSLHVKYEEDPLLTFKGRGVSVVTNLVLELNKGGDADYIALGGTSTGNLLKAIAASAQRNSFLSIVVVPNGTPDKLIDDAVSLGAYVIRTGDNYSTVNGIIAGIISNNPGIAKKMATINIEARPVYGEGSKTIGLEIIEQSGWKAPDHIVYPVAAGLSSSRIYGGMKQLRDFGLVERLQTAMHIVQPEACHPVVRAWQRGDSEVTHFENPQPSLAQTLCVPIPSNGYEVLKMLKDSRGTAIAVDDSSIREGMELVDRYTGFVTEPVGGAIVAAAKRLVIRGSIHPNETTVLVLTDSYRKGNEIVIPEGIPRGKIIDVEPRTPAVKKVLEEILGIAA